MVFGSKAAVGLDIGSTNVKAVQLRRVGKTGIELERFGMAEIYPDGDKKASAANPHDAKVAAVKNALGQAKISAKQAITAVSGESIIVRYIQLPSMPETELRNALRWEAEEYIPFSIEDVNLDSVILGQSEDGERVDVLLVSAKKDLVASHLEIIRDAGLTSQTVDVDSFAFLNCFEVNYQPALTEVVALVNIGAEITNINVYLGGVSRFSRDISIAGDTITGNIQAKLGADWAEAERVKIQEGAPEPAEQNATATPEDDSSLLDTIRGTVERITGEDLGDDTPEAVAGKVIRNTLANLVGEIRRSIQFFENQPSGQAVQRVVLGGGTAMMRNLPACLERELGLPVEVIDPLRRVAVRSRDVDAAALESSKLMLGVGIGLALRNVVD
jgi:type IV pilus assembly protein PilM